jgi:hypothetical protein
VPQYSILLSEKPETIPVTANTKILIQAQGDNVCYRYGAEQEPIDGFTLIANTPPVRLSLPLTIWAYGLTARVVIMEGMDA